MSVEGRGPRVLSGALVSFDLLKPISSVIPFQYNPATLNRRLSAQTSGGEGDRAESIRFTGAPSEVISLDISLDATDLLEQGDNDAIRLGLHPRLAALEMLLYPPSATVIANTALLLGGTIEITSPMPALTLFIWGTRRVLPVSVSSMSITEQAWDVNLNPIRAEASLELRVLTYNDLSVYHPGYAVFLSHQLVKEAMASVGALNSLEPTGVSDISLS